MRLTGGVTKEYDRLWSSCAIRPRRSGAVDEIVDRIVANKGRYQKAGRPSGVPWYVVGIIHMLESSGNFSTHLHNGDPLSARTVHVPAGRPAKGSPPFTWEESAADALAGQGLGRWRDWSVPGTLYVFERYNGFGYRPRGIPSPYLWSFSNHYSKGKFVADGRFSPSAVSQQCGSGVLLRRLAGRGLVKLDGRGMGRRASQRSGPAPDDDGILLRGSKGAKVTALKKRLRAWLETAAPGEWERFRVSDNDVFGAPLERAVKAFQERAGLEPDGEVGPLTLAALKQRPRKPKTPKVRELAHAGALRIGSTGKQVRLVQECLSLQRAQVAVDGEFGPATQKAVKAFQGRHGLRQTGAVDAATWAALTAPMSAALTPVLRRMALGMTVVSYATQHLKQHAREVGGQNRGPWVRLYTDGKEGTPYPWCAGFATFCLKQACDSLGMPMPVQRTLSCDVMASSSGSRFLRGSDSGAHGRIRPGSLFLQQARGGERRLYKYRHTGIVVSAGRDTMATIEGNTNDDGSAEGYEVCARTRGYANMDFIVL